MKQQRTGGNKGEIPLHVISGEENEIQEPWNTGTQERRNAGTQEHRNTGTQEHRNTGTQESGNIYQIRIRQEQRRN